MSRQDESQMREEPVRPSEIQQMMAEVREEQESDWNRTPDRWQKPGEDPEDSMESRWESLLEGWEPVVDLSRHPQGHELTEEFQVLVKRRWMQMLEDRDPQAPLTMRLEEHELLLPPRQEENLHRIAQLMNSVARWMASTGRKVTVQHS
jgi:hypothetical protein